MLAAAAAAAAESAVVPSKFTCGDRSDDCTANWTLRAVDQRRRRRRPSGGGGVALSVLLLLLLILPTEKREGRPSLSIILFYFLSRLDAATLLWLPSFLLSTVFGNAFGCISYPASISGRCLYIYVILVCWCTAGADTIQVPPLLLEFTLPHPFFVLFPRT